jgi:bidirectional [NiFe] hydrogenase diaphorase subunit
MGTATTTQAARPAPPAGGQAPTPAANDPLTSDKRYKLLEATMRKHGYQGNALIESLHTAQESFGFLDDFTLRHIARSLHLPYSKVYGVATFYNYFTLKPQGEHTWVVCLGTACYIKGAGRIIEEVEKANQFKAGGTTADGKVSLIVARCLGSCSLAPAVVLDGNVLGKLTPETVLSQVATWRGGK